MKFLNSNKNFIISQKIVEIGLGGIFPTSQERFWVFSNYRKDLHSVQIFLRGAVFGCFPRETGLAIAQNSGCGSCHQRFLQKLL